MINIKRKRIVVTLTGKQQISAPKQDGISDDEIPDMVEIFSRIMEQNTDEHHTETE